MLNHSIRFPHQLQCLDGIPLLLLRLYLAPVMIQAGWNKWQHFDSTISWFGDSLGMPVPGLMAALAVTAELLGGILILLGLLTRVSAIPLAVTMAVAAITVHWENGWLAIADASSWLAMGNESIAAAPEKLQMAKNLLAEHGHYDWLTSSGNFVILNNGIEFATTYFLMLLVLVFYGGGRFVSLDHYLFRPAASQSK